MHILLTVLSVIGKILLAVLILLILIAALLLFAPVRYQAGVRRRTKTDFSEVEILFGIRYLAGIIRVAGKWKGGKWGAALKLFGRDLRVIGDESVLGKEDHGGGREKPSETIEEINFPEEKEEAPLREPDQETGRKTEPEPERKPGPEPERKPDPKKGPGGLLGNAAEALSRILARLTDLVTSLPDLLWKLPDSLDAIDEKIYGLKKEIRPWLAGCSKEAYRAILRQLMFLLSHYRIRKVKGHLEFGTGDPALTGAAGGVIRSVLPAASSGFELQPVFHDRMLDTDMLAEGHVRLCHLVKAVVVLLLNKNIRKMIRRLRRMRGGK